MKPRPISFCITTKHDYTIRSYLEHVPKPPFRLRVVHYPDMAPEPVPEHHVFADLERVSPRGLRLLTRLWGNLEALNAGLRLLNHPYRCMRRKELLRVLRESGANDFDAWHVSEHRRPTRFPVFLRDAREHSGAITGLLRTPAEFDAALKEKVEGVLSREDVLVVEHLDTADAQGVYRKYSAFNVGGDIFPVHIQVSKNWVVKTADIVDEKSVREELEFLDSFPQENHVREVFRTAAIDFGRIDFGMHKGRPQVWEINTNPHLFAATGESPLRSQVRERFAARFTDAMKKIAHG